MDKPIRKAPGAEPSGNPWKPDTMASMGNVLNSEARNGKKESATNAANEESLADSSFPASRKLSDDREARAVPDDVLVALAYGLELVRCGAMLVPHEGHPHLANRAALAILEKKDGLSLSRTGLVADRASDTQLLRRLLKDAITAPELGEPKESPITLPRKKAHNALIVRIIPGPGLECWPGTENRAALMTLYDEDKSLEIDESILCRLYGLTRGEAAFAAKLVKGKSLEQAATELFISPHTARTHLKRIFMKTDTHRQTELVVRIFSAVS